MKRTIRLTEADLHNIIESSVRRIINEDFNYDLADTARSNHFKQIERSGKIDKLRRTPDGNNQYIFMTMKSDLLNALSRFYTTAKHNLKLKRGTPEYETFRELNSKCTDLYNFLRNMETINIDDLRH